MIRMMSHSDMRFSFVSVAVGAVVSVAAPRETPGPALDSRSQTPEYSTVRERPTEVSITAAGVPAQSIVAPVSFDRLAGLASIMVAIGALAYAAVFIAIVEGAGSDALAVWFALLLLGGVATVPVFVALYRRLAPTDPGVALTAFLLGLGGALGGVLHGSYNLAIQITPPPVVVAGQEEVARGFLRYAAAGLAMLVVGWLILRGGALPAGLAYLAVAGGAILVFIYIGRLFDFIQPGDYVSLLPPIVYGFVIHPLWYVWFGVVLWRGAPPRPLPLAS